MESPYPHKRFRAFTRTSSGLGSEANLTGSGTGGGVRYVDIGASKFEWNNAENDRLSREDGHHECVGWGSFVHHTHSLIPNTLCFVLCLSRVCRYCILEIKCPLLSLMLEHTLVKVLENCASKDRKDYISSRG